MDELNRIESIYGCVAEYNRCMAERDYEDYEPSEEEIAESVRRMAEYYAEIERLNGNASDFVKALIAEWATTKPQYEEWNSVAYYATSEWNKARTLNIVAKVVDHYGVVADEEWASFYRVPQGKFAISVEYHDGCRIYNKHIGNLDLPTFKLVFRDLYEAGLRPTMSHNGQYISNVSLGHLLHNYIDESEV